jgi:hypothetical protein
MASHAPTHNGSRRHGGPNGLVRLGWTHFWLLGGILGGMLALVLLVFYVHLSSQ